MYAPVRSVCPGEARVFAAGEHDSDSSLDFAAQGFMFKLPVTGSGVNSNDRKE